MHIAGKVSRYIDATLYKKKNCVIRDPPARRDEPRGGRRRAHARPPARAERRVRARAARGRRAERGARAGAARVARALAGERGPAGGRRGGGAQRDRPAPRRPAQADGGEPAADGQRAVSRERGWGRGGAPPPGQPSGVQQAQL